jgi:MFS family permease
MRLGILIFFLVALFAGPDLQLEMLPLVPLFFTFALMATALTRSASLKIEDVDEKTRFGGSWLGFLAAVVILVNIGGFILALFLADMDKRLVLDVFKIILAVILTIVFILTAPFWFLLEAFFSQLEENPSVDEDSLGQRADPGPSSGTKSLNYGDTLDAVLEFLRDSILIIVAVTVISLVIIFWLAYFLKRDNVLFENADDKSEDRRERINALRLLRNRFRKLTEALKFLQMFGLGSELFGALTIRWAYARMENMAKKRGYPRLGSQTPYEYRIELAKAYPGGETHIRIITEAYIKVRYGEIPENNRELDIVRESLRQLRELEKPKTTSTSNS